jgi:hypothetical protein
MNFRRTWKDKLKTKHSLEYTCEKWKRNINNALSKELIKPKLMIYLNVNKGLYYYQYSQR